MVPYGAETQAQLSTDAADLRIFQRKVLLKISVAVRVDDNFRIRCCMSSLMTWTFCIVLTFMDRACRSKGGVCSVLLYGALTLLSSDAAAFRVFERKVFGNIFGLVQVVDDFRMRCRKSSH